VLQQTQQQPLWANFALGTTLQLVPVVASATVSGTTEYRNSIGLSLILLVPFSDTVVPETMHIKQNGNLFSSLLRIAVNVMQSILR